MQRHALIARQARPQDFDRARKHDDHSPFALA
jgi:hypothetical protein